MRRFQEATQAAFFPHTHFAIREDRSRPARRMNACKLRVDDCADAGTLPSGEEIRSTPRLGWYDVVVVIRQSDFAASRTPERRRRVYSG